MPKRKAAKLGTSRVSKEHRQDLFFEVYVTNGNNGTQAAIDVGISPKTAAEWACLTLKDPKIAARLAARSEQVLTKAQLNTDRWANEMVALGHFDPGELYDEEGNLIPIHKLPEHVRRAIASVEAVVGKDGETTKKIKFWDKNTALANIGKHLGMFEQDNRQKTAPIQVLVQLVG